MADSVKIKVTYDLTDLGGFRSFENHLKNMAKVLSYYKKPYAIFCFIDNQIRRNVDRSLSWAIISDNILFTRRTPMTFTEFGTKDSSLVPSTVESLGSQQESANFHESLFANPYGKPFEKFLALIDVVRIFSDLVNREPSYIADIEMRFQINNPYSTTPRSEKPEDRTMISDHDEHFPRCTQEEFDEQVEKVRSDLEAGLEIYFQILIEEIEYLLGEPDPELKYLEELVAVPNSILGAAADMQLLQISDLAVQIDSQKSWPSLIALEYRADLNGLGIDDFVSNVRAQLKYLNTFDEQLKPGVVHKGLVGPAHSDLVRKASFGL